MSVSPGRDGSVDALALGFRQGVEGLSGQATEVDPPGNDGDQGNESESGLHIELSLMLQCSIISGLTLIPPA